MRSLADALRRIVPAILTLACTLALCAQRLPIRNYTTDDGLPASQIWSVHQDRRGLMWFGTTQGATRYDGQNFSTLTLADGLPDLLVRVIRETPDGAIWFGTNGGVAEYDGRRIRSFTSADGLGRGPVWDATVDRYGNLWFATQDGGASHFDGRAFRTLTTSDGILADYVYAIYADASGALWLGHRTEGLTRVLAGPDGLPSEVRTFTPADGLPQAGIRAIVEDRRGNLYFGTRGGGVVRYDGSSFRSYGKDEGLSGDDVYALLITAHGELAVGTVDGGVSLCSIPEFSKCRWIQERNGLNFNVVYSIGEDREHILWVGLNNGLSKVVNERFVSLTRIQGLASDSAHNVLPDKDGVWLGTGGGLSRVFETGDPHEPYRVENYTRERGLPSDGVWCVIRDDSGSLWIGTRNGLARFKAGRFDTFSVDDGLAGEYVSDIHQDSRGRLWISTSEGISVATDPGADHPSFRSYTVADGLSGSVAYGVTESGDGRIWIALATNGIDVWDGRVFRNYNTENGLRSNTVNHVHQSKRGTIWAGTTGGGLAKLPQGSARFSSYGFEAGLPSDTIVSVIDDPDTDRLWLGTGSGIALFDPDADGGKVVASYTKRDGLAGNELVMGGGLAFDAQGRLWVATTQGATRITFSDGGRESVEPPGVLITTAEFGGGRIYAAPFTSVENGSSPAVPPIADGIEVSSDQNRFKVGFRGLSFADESGVRYEHRLRGFEESWSGATDIAFKEYTNLPPGEYTFEVKAKSARSPWSLDPARFSFTVLPAFYQTAWARIGMILALIGAVVGAVRLRTKNIERRNRELRVLVNERTEELKEYSRRLERHARELQEANISILEANRTKSRFLATMSHELRTPLNSIIGFSEILAQRLPGTTGQKDIAFLQNILDSGHHLLNLINNLLDLSKIEAGRMEVHAEPIRLTEMISSVRSVLLGLASRRSVVIETVIADGIDVVKVDGPKLRQILYNLISNAIKFSPDGAMVTISVSRVGRAQSSLGTESFRIDVVDRGPGISDQEQQLIFEEFRQTAEGSIQPGATGLGLAIVRKLVEIQGGRISVESRKGEGSRFHVTLPLEVEEVPHERPSTSTRPDRHTILVVEDDPAFQETLRNTLTDAGYEVVGLTRGEDVESAAERVHPSLITLDVVLPGIDGWEVLRRIKSHDTLGSTPVVMVTASNNRELGLALGADDVLVKPLRLDQVVARIMTLAPPGKVSREVLVIDDDPNVVTIVKAALESHPYNVISASSGEQGVDTARSARPSLVILDLMMPGMNGFEVASQLQADASTASIPLVVLTARDLTTEERAELNGKIAAFLSKGVASPTQILDTVRRLDARATS